MELKFPKKTDDMKFLLNGSAATNSGPTAKEFFLSQVEWEHDNGNHLHSIFFQVRSLFQALQDRYSQVEVDVEDAAVKSRSLAETFFAAMNDLQAEEFKINPLMQYVYQSLTTAPKANPERYKSQQGSNLVSCDFLQGITDPLAGVRKIEEICQEFPTEWTILQLCKGPHSESTFFTFPQIHQHDAAIYVALLRHTRSCDYPMPICIRFSKPEQVELFEKFACIANRFKERINVDPKVYTSTEAKQQYWTSLDELNMYIARTLEEFQKFFYPWKFLFMGKPTFTGLSESSYQSKAFTTVDDFCNEYDWESRERVLLSLAALHVFALSDLEVFAICQTLTTNEQQQAIAAELLTQLKTIASQGTDSDANSTKNLSKYYPCILVVDERLDHFFWEELNVQQEFSRISSLQCLHRLYHHHKLRIHNGYLKVDITTGGCVVNPDNNLPHSEMRMRHFFEYWTPHWLLKFAKKPSHCELTKDFFKRPCFVYAGHGSGLQYINGKHIAKQRIESVVFLFGCDSSRLNSNGLYSELVGPHLYYHAAMCPTLVGTLMPALDANMDCVATEILSRWIAPKSESILPWNKVDRIVWMKEGIIKPKCSKSSLESSVTDATHHRMGSLCAILARVHQRTIEQKYYNTVQYVCRGLPAWNCQVQVLP